MSLLESEEFTDGLDEDDDESDDDRARVVGWRPFEEWRGPPEEWKTSTEYLELIETEFPVARETARKLGNKNVRLERTVEALSTQVATMQTESVAALREFGAQLRAAEDRARKAARAELLAQRDGAVEAGDTQTFRDVERQLVELDAEAPPPAPPPPGPAPVPADQQAIIGRWIAANPWYSADVKMKGAMIAHHTAVRTARPDMPLLEQLQLAKRRLVDDMPNAFEPEEIADLTRPPRRAATSLAEEPPQRRVPPAVSRPGGGTPQGQGRTRTVWDQITDPTEREGVKQQFERFKSLNNDPEMPASEYVTLYLDPKADVLALRRARKKP